MKGGIGTVAYIYTEGTFRPDLIVPIAEKFGMDAAAVLDNNNLFLVLAAKTAEEPFQLLDEDSIIIRSTTICKVNSQGRNAENVKKLQYAGIYTCDGLMMHTMKSLIGIKGLSHEASVDTLCEAVVKIVNTTGSPSRTTYNPIPFNRVDHLHLARNQEATDNTDNGDVGAQEEQFEALGLSVENLILVVEDENHDDYPNRVGNVVPILEFQNADWENTFNVENNLGDRQGEVDLDTHNWGDLVERVHDVYEQQTGNQRVNGLNSANCWPGKLVHFCIASGYPGLNQWDDDFFDVKEWLDVIKIRPDEN